MMTGDDLIAELSRAPVHLPVETVVSSVSVGGTSRDYREILLDESDSRRVTDVEFRGNHILVIG